LEDKARARELFFQYDGSRFYMSRDGVEDEYVDYAVPKQLEKQWLEELTQVKLDLLEQPGNSLVLNFLLNNRDTRHLARILDATPQGPFGLRCAFLEGVLKYVELCTRAQAINRVQIREAADYVLKQAQIISSDVGHDSSDRVRQIIASANELWSSTGGGAQ